MPESISKSTIQELIELRYGASIPDILRDFDNANPVIETLLSHKSVREYKDQSLPIGTLELLATTAQSASSSSNLQAWSVVAIQDKVRKEAAATLCGDQDSIRQAPLFLVFIADLARLQWVGEHEGQSSEGLSYFEMFVVAALDAAFAAQNVATSAESEGLGICYIGGARNHPHELAELLRLPQRAVALFGMTVGYPKDELTTTVKPRLPQPGVLHYETYSETPWPAEIEAYNRTMDEFYEAQQMKSHQTWSQSTAKRVSGPGALAGRDVLRQILEERGFGLR